MRKRGRSPKAEAELDITSFMNLMIVLVPVLLLNMVFSTITVLDLKLPEPSEGSSQPDDKNQQLELVIRKDIMRLYYPAGILLKEFPNKTAEAAADSAAPASNVGAEPTAPAYDFKGLSFFLRQVKQSLQGKGIEKRDIVILSEPDVEYQTIVSAMDTVRSYKAVLAADVVDAELFPDISMGDAPRLVEVGTP